MGMMMAVAFQRYGRLYYLDPGPYSPAVGDRVLVPTDSGPEVAECIWAPQWVSEEIDGLPVCAGLATDEHLTRDEANRARRAEGRVVARRLIREHGLPMKVIGTDYVDTGNVLTVYFSAPHRVDFRALVRDMAARLRVRVELRQIGPRDEARLQGGIGPCGRLMCCLKYEHPLYQDFRDNAPKIGASVDTPDGPGQVVGHSVPADSVVVRLSADGRRTACSRASVCGSRKAYEATYGPGRTGCG